MNRRQFLSAATVLGSSGVIASATETPYQAASGSQPPAASILESTASPNAECSPRVGIVAIGSSGCWILDRLNGKLPRLLRSVAVDTNGRLLQRAFVDRRILTGNGVSVPVEPKAARVLAESVAIELASAVDGVDLLYMLTDMRGAIETELALIVARIASHLQVMTIGAVISPLGSGGDYTHPIAQDGVDRLIRQGVPMISLIQRRIGGKKLSAFWSTPMQMQVATAFERLYRSTVVTREGNGQSLIWLDSEDVQAVFTQSAYTEMVIGYGSVGGPDGSELSAHQAISHPLFDADREGADCRILVSVEASPGCLKLREVNRAMRVVRNAFPYCFLIGGAFRNPSLNDTFRVTVVAPKTPRTQR